MFFHDDDDNTYLINGIEKHADDSDGVSILHHSNNPLAKNPPDNSIISSATKFKKEFYTAKNGGSWASNAEKEAAKDWFKGEAASESREGGANKRSEKRKTRKRNARMREILGRKNEFVLFKRKKLFGNNGNSKKGTTKKKVIFINKTRKV